MTTVPPARGAFCWLGDGRALIHVSCTPTSEIPWDFIRFDYIWVIDERTWKLPLSSIAQNISYSSRLALCVELGVSSLHG